MIAADRPICAYIGRWSPAPGINKASRNNNTIIITYTRTGCGVSAAAAAAAVVDLTSRRVAEILSMLRRQQLCA